MPVKKYKHAIRWVPCESLEHCQNVFAVMESIAVPKHILKARDDARRAYEIARQEQIEHDQLVGIA